MRYLVIGTAGHIDHGKTELVRALTGVDTDRLKEEKLRGMTIDLGFAEFQITPEIEAGIVDVPGHEKFVRNMLAGSSGIDLVLLVIAANEGVMPQTREHLAICELLRVPRGLVVLTKTDLAEPEWMELVREEVREFIRGTFLEDCPVVAVSSRTGEGLEKFKRELARMADQVPSRSETDTFRLPVDRSFTIKGFGTVVTGTVFGGKVAVGDQVRILPSDFSTRVKGIENHGRKAEVSIAGQRTAINLVGIEKAAVKRGDVMIHSDTLVPSRILDVSLKIISGAGRPVKNGAEVRFHAGTAEIMAKIRVLGRDQIRPGEESYAQLMLQEAVVAVARDRFVIRRASPVITIGGGEILDPLPARRHRLRDPGVEEWLKKLKEEDLPGLILAQVGRSGLTGMESRQLIPRVPGSHDEIRRILEDLAGKRKVVSTRSRFFDPEQIRDLAGEVQGRMEGFHKSNPILPGMAREELKGYFPAASPEALAEAIKILEEQGEVVREGEIIRLSSHRVELGLEEEDLRRRIWQLFQQGGTQPPEVGELKREFAEKKEKLEDILHLLVREGKLVRVREGLYYPSEMLKEIEVKLGEYLQKEDSIEVPRFKEIFGITRKWAIPLLEYFDAKRLTLRVGNVRKLYSK